MSTPHGENHPGDALSALIDGELGSADTHATLAHLDDCASCRRELDEVRAVRRMMRLLPAVDAPSELAPPVPSLPAPAPPTPATVHPLSRRVPATLNVAASLVVGLALVALAGGRAGPMSPDVAMALSDHDAVLDAIRGGGQADTVSTSPPPTVSLQGIDRLPPPFRAPLVLAGYRLSRVYESRQGLHLLYEMGTSQLSVFQAVGELDGSGLPDNGRWGPLPDGSRAWRGNGGQVMVRSMGGLVVTLVGDGGEDAGDEVMTAAATDLPGPRSLSMGQSVRRACKEALEGLSLAGSSS